MRHAGLRYRDARGALDLPLPRLPGAHQAANAALAVAMLRHQDALYVPDSALATAMSTADWPARLQLLSAGPLRDLLPEGAELWLDGAHNPAAARAVADHFRETVPPGRPFHLVLGLIAGKDASGVLAPFAGSGAMAHAVPVPSYEHHPPKALVPVANGLGLEAQAADDVPSALKISRAARTPRRRCSSWARSISPARCWRRTVSRRLEPLPARRLRLPCRRCRATRRSGRSASSARTGRCPAPRRRW